MISACLQNSALRMKFSSGSYAVANDTSMMQTSFSRHLKGETMERKELINLCQAVAKLPDNVEAKDIPKKYRVMYNNIEWYPTEYILWFDMDGNPKHSATIHSLDTKTTIRVPLDKLEAVKEEYNDQT